MQLDKIVSRGPTKREQWIIKVLVTLGILSAFFFLHWLFKSEHRGFWPLYLALVATFLFQVIRLLAEWFFSLKLSVPEKPVVYRKPTVDVLTTYCAGEPKEMVIKTLIAIKEIKYPHTAYLCDEENDLLLQEVCLELGVIHVTRNNKINAKAGNINNALYSVAKGEICLILDPDHVPHPDFLDEVIPFFENPEVGFVQVVQAYYNTDHSIIAKAAAEQTYQFYGPMMMCLNSYGAVPAIGANCTFRRAALDSIGGHAPGLTEDMHTAMLLHAKGWKSVYYPAILAKGLVPWNFSGYCKQQLKWSRGTFDLLFNVLPGIFKKLSWKQRLYYLTPAFFYSYGVVALFDFLIPILSLLLLVVPAKIQLSSFIVHYLPLFATSIIIRVFNQRWLLEEHEKGFFILGGTLLKATWWISLTGFVYALVNKKVPYIPTPKDRIPETPLKLLVPNMVVIALSAIAIIYGLVRDYNPFSLFMAGLAFTNIAILSFGGLMTMQHLIQFVHRLFKGTFISKGSNARKMFFRLRHAFYKGFQQAAVVVSAGLFILFLILFYHQRKLREEHLKEHAEHTRNYGKYLIGLGCDYYAPVQGTGNNCKGAKAIDFLAAPFQIDSGFSYEAISFSKGCYAKKKIPMLILKEDPESLLLTSGDTFSLLLGPFFGYLREHMMPLMISLDRELLHQPTDGKEDSVYAVLFVKLVYLAANQGLDNITWIWETSNPEKDGYLAENLDYISWILVKSKHLMQKEGNHQLLAAWKNRHPIPLMIANDTSAIQPYNYIRTGEKSFYPVRELAQLYIDFSHDSVSTLSGNTSGANDGPLLAYFERKSPQFKALLGIAAGQAARLSSSLYPGKEIVQAWKQQYPYIKGIAYNPGHDWRDSKHTIPLTRREVDRDFDLISSMGANTIRRYQPSVYDYNILRAARRYNLNVLYGFWFDPTDDYSDISLKKRRYKRSAMRKVRQYLNNPSITAWTLGNETWGLLKHHYGQPYLTGVRICYQELIEELAREIRKLDGRRVIFAAEEHSIVLPAALRSSQALTPTIDLVGVNSYYIQNISRLDSIATVHYPDKYYLVSEFGPNGYWNKALNIYRNDTILMEQSSHEKARQYKLQWEQNILPHAYKNIGGVAFAWKDRFESTATWFGITDIFANKKPAYSLLRKVWKGDYRFFPIPEFTVVAPQNLLSPGVVYSYNALSEKMHERGRYYYKWMVYEEKSFRKIAETDFELANYSFNFKTPKRRSDYRIYVYVSDGKGHVVTTSRQLEIKWD